MKPSFVPLTAEAFAAVAGAAPTRSLRGFAAIVDERPVMVVGIYPDDDRHVLVSHFSDRLRAEAGSVFGRRTIALCARQTEELLDSVPGAVDSLADPDFAGSGMLLKKIGFALVKEDVYRRDPVRAMVMRAERLMKERGDPVDIPVRHYFSDGVYAREVTIPAGSIVTGKIHKRENLNILSKGEISVLVGDRIERLRAPVTIVSAPGTKRIAYTHTEVVWTTIHGTNERDLAKIEAEFIAQDEAEWLAYQRALPEKVAA